MGTKKYIWFGEIGIKIKNMFEFVGSVIKIFRIHVLNFIQMIQFNTVCRMGGDNFHDGELKLRQRERANTYLYNSKLDI